MKRILFRSVAKLTEDPVEVFWLTGFVPSGDNEWKIRVVYRNMRTDALISVLEPIGMLPILSLGLWFDHGVTQMDRLPGETLEAVIPDVGKPEIVTSADIHRALYPLPPNKVGHQKLFRYQTAHGTVLVPTVELIRALFIHSRALAVALMRPAGLEQLYSPMEPGSRESASIRFTSQIAKDTLNQALAMEFAWVALDREARHAWDSVRRLSIGQDYVLFDPPSIRNSTWCFRGVEHNGQYLVLDLLRVGGRYAPVQNLKYSHPGLKRVVSIGAPRHRSRQDGDNAEERDEDIDVDDGEEGSGSYRSARVVSTIPRVSRFENKVHVFKGGKVVHRHEADRSSEGSERPNLPRVVRVTTGERASASTLSPMEFRLLTDAPPTQMGDLEALDETVRHMRDKLPDVVFSMGLVHLTRDKAAAYVGSMRRVAMAVRIDPPGRPPIVMIDIERTGIVALSLMALYFGRGISEDQIEGAIQETLDGWADSGGHWSSGVEARLRKVCHCDRIPKAMTPRGGFEKLAEIWAHRLMDRFGL